MRISQSTGYVGIGLGPNEPSYSLDVAGYVRAYNLSITSDSTLKRDIKNLSSSRIAGLYDLDAKTYKFKPLKLSGNHRMSSLLNDSTKSPHTPQIDTSKVRIGLLAQQIKPLFPELVEKDSAGILSVDYMGLIPVIIEALKAQNKEIQKLQSKLNQVQATPMIATGTVTTSSGTTEAYLGKNKPNPFNENTTIDFYLPQTVQKAVFYIYDLQGREIKSYPVAQRENASITIQASELQPGMYYYSLIADGKIVGTEKMILTD